MVITKNLLLAIIIFGFFIEGMAIGATLESSQFKSTCRIIKQQQDAIIKNKESLINSFLKAGFLPVQVDTLTNTTLTKIITCDDLGVDFTIVILILAALLAIMSYDYVHWQKENEA